MSLQRRDPGGCPHRLRSADDILPLWDFSFIQPIIYKSPKCKVDDPAVSPIEESLNTLHPKPCETMRIWVHKGFDCNLTANLRTSLQCPWLHCSQTVKTFLSRKFWKIRMIQEILDCLTALQSIPIKEALQIRSQNAVKASYTSSKRR